MAPSRSRSEDSQTYLILCPLLHLRGFLTSSTIVGTTVSFDCSCFFSSSGAGSSYTAATGVFFYFFSSSGAGSSYTAATGVFYYFFSSSGSAYLVGGLNCSSLLNMGRNSPLSPGVQVKNSIDGKTIDPSERAHCSSLSMNSRATVETALTSLSGLHPNIKMQSRDSSTSMSSSHRSLF